MLHPYQTAAEWNLPASADSLAGHKPGGLTLLLVRLLSGMFSADPQVFSEQDGTVTLLYREAAFLCEDFLERCGEVVAAIHKYWPVALLGSTEGSETGEITACWRDKHILVRLRNASGNPFDMLNGLCVRIQAGSPADAGHLAQIIGQMGWRATCAGINRSHDVFLREQRVEEPTEGSLFSYISFDENSAAEDYLYCLDMVQKKELWRVFLQDNVQPREFDWLFSEVRRGGQVHLLEWELALQMVLKDLGFVVANDFGKKFTVQDGEGQKRYFDFEHGGSAEKMFLKILFPIGR